MIYPLIPVPQGLFICKTKGRPSPRPRPRFYRGMAIFPRPRPRPRPRSGGQFLGWPRPRSKIDSKFLGLGEICRFYRGFDRGFLLKFWEFFYKLTEVNEYEFLELKIK